MTKARVLLTLAACVVLTASACSAAGEEAGVQAKSCGGAAEKYVIGVSQGNVAEPYRARMDAEIRAAAAGVGRFELHFSDAQQDNSKQVEQVEDFLVQGIDLLIISPAETAPLSAVVKKAYEQGTPVLVLDRKVNGDAYTSYLGADNVELGRKAGEYVAQSLLPGGGKVLELKGMASSTLARERGDGFLQGIGGRNIELAGVADADWLRDKAREQAAALFHAHPDAQVVYAQNDAMAEGVHQAAQAAGLTGVKIVGTDGLPGESGGIKAVETGRLAATFVYPTGGREAVEAAKKILVDCQAVPKTQALPSELVTPANAAAVHARLTAIG